MADIVLQLSGGNANTDPNQSLGGYISNDPGGEITTSNNNLNNLFDNITKSENFNNTTDYRCIFILNKVGGGGPFASAEIYLNNTSYADIEIGFAPEGYDINVEQIGNESIAPTGVVWSQPDAGSPLVFPGAQQLTEGQFIALWIKRTATSIPGTGTVTDTIGLSISGVE